jgi:hypothetical protein
MKLGPVPQFPLDGPLQRLKSLVIDRVVAHFTGCDMPNSRDEAAP